MLDALAAAAALLTLRWDTATGEHMRRDRIEVATVPDCYALAEELAAAWEAAGLGLNATVRCELVPEMAAPPLPPQPPVQPDPSTGGGGGPALQDGERAMVAGEP